MNKTTKPCSVNTISLVNVSKAFLAGENQLTVIDTVSFEFKKGQTYALIGASGTGKSTLLHLIAGFEQPSAGKILYDTLDQATFTKKQKQNYLQYAFGILLQNAYLIDELSVIENVMLKGLSAGRSEYECRSQAVSLLEAVGIPDKLDAQPAQLSGGQQQRAALARALFDQPDFILADEPTGNLDESTGTRVIDVLLENQQQFGMGVIISTHDMTVARRMDVVLELKNGKLHKVH